MLRLLAVAGDALALQIGEMGRHWRGAEGAALVARGIKEQPTRLLHAARVLKALRAVELGDGLSLDLVSVKQSVVGEALRRKVDLPHEVDAVLDAGVQPLADRPIGSCRREPCSPPFSGCGRCSGRRRLKKRRCGAAEFMQAASACLHAR